MILSDLRDYVKQRGQVSLSDIALHFDADYEVARQMLDVWIKKGKIHKQLATVSCGSSCNKCNASSTEIYVWGTATLNSSGLLPGDCQHQ